MFTNADGPSSTTQDLLRTALEVAVPLWIERLRHQSVDYIIGRARECGEVIAERGDIIQFRSKVKGKTAEAFDRLAEGIAAAAIVAPGGITFLGVRWEVKR